ncbi:MULTISPECIES: hypothetical protein [Rhizobium]|uniref:hypothetical protein n=1 Tax=Rhizobium TaxID=379 RepID=UPI000F4F838A|nr:MULTISPECIES: hypothetical protein [Rhizobium]
MSDRVREIELAELHPLGEECDGAYYKLDGAALVFVEGDGRSKKLADNALLHEAEGAVILEFGSEPLIFQWILTRKDTENIVGLDSRLKHPITEAETAFYKKTTGRVPDDANKIWKSFKGFTLCPVRNTVPASIMIS